MRFRSAIAIPNTDIEKSGERTPAKIGEHQISRVFVDRVECPNASGYVGGERGQSDCAQTDLVLNEKYRRPRKIER